MPSASSPSIALSILRAVLPNAGGKAEPADNAWTAQRTGRSRTRTISVVAIFTSLIIASDYALAPVLNVKLVDTLVFASAYSFGLKIGVYIAVCSEIIWGLVSPYGFGGYIIPFLVAGELLYAFAGWFASKVWRRSSIRPFGTENFYFGAIIAICAFVWDTETNFATGLIALWPHPSLLGLIGFELAGSIFMVFHELGDFVIGSSLAPIAITYLSRTLGPRPRVDLVNEQRVEQREKSEQTEIQRPEEQ